jgi:hypothetical protein
LWGAGGVVCAEWPVLLGRSAGQMEAALGARLEEQLVAVIAQVIAVLDTRVCVDVCDYWLAQKSIQGTRAPRGPLGSCTAGLECYRISNQPGRLPARDGRSGPSRRLGSCGPLPAPAPHAAAARSPSCVQVAGAVWCRRLRRRQQLRVGRLRAEGGAAEGVDFQARPQLRDRPHAQARRPRHRVRTQNDCRRRPIHPRFLRRSGSMRCMAAALTHAYTRAHAQGARHGGGGARAARPGPGAGSLQGDDDLGHCQGEPPVRPAGQGNGAHRVAGAQG